MCRYAVQRSWFCKESWETESLLDWERTMGLSTEHITINLELQEGNQPEQKDGKGSQEALSIPLPGHISEAMTQSPNSKEQNGWNK